MCARECAKYDDNYLLFLPLLLMINYLLWNISLSEFEMAVWHGPSDITLKKVIFVLFVLLFESVLRSPDLMKKCNALAKVMKKTNFSSYKGNDKLFTQFGEPRKKFFFGYKLVNFVKYLANCLEEEGL